MRPARPLAPSSLPARVLALATLLLAAPAWADLHALLIGIDYRHVPHVTRLNAAVNDAEDWQRLLTDTYAVPPERIRLLTETQATRGAILAAIEDDLIEATRPGDTVLLAYSGHGVQVPDALGTQAADPLKADAASEQRRLAEALVPYDVRIDPATQTVSNLILDSELNALLQDLEGRQVVLVLDNCHAAGATRELIATAAPTRSLDLPWEDSWATRLDWHGPPPARGVSLGERRPDWHPPYHLFAAARYYQKAHEYPLYGGRNGALTHALLARLGGRPSEGHRNGELIDHARRFVRETMGLGAGVQEPQYYGPPGGERAIFPLPAPIEAAPAAPQGQDGERPLRIALRGTAPWRAHLQRRLARAPFATLDPRADLIVRLAPRQAELYNGAGRRLRRLSGDDLPGQVERAVRARHLLRLLARLDNPAAPFDVDLWLEEPGRTRFRAGEPVTLYYRVDGLPPGERAYLTLLNLAPDGTLSILYPKRGDLAHLPGRRLYLNARVQPGRTHRIPRTAAALRPGEHVAIDLRLERGREHFKAIVTRQPIPWQDLDAGDFRRRFAPHTARRIVVQAKERVTHTPAWAAASLTVEVD